jgi:ketosteroid isomerase-like protein
MRTAFSALLTIVLTTTGALAANEAAVRKEIDACYSRMAKALGAKDLKTVMSYVAPDYTQISLRGGTAGRARMEADIRETMSSMTSLSASYAIQKLTTKGKEAIVNFRYRFTGTTKPDESGKPRRVSAEIPMRAVWISTAKGWKLRRMQELKGATVTLDGKRQDPHRSR